MQTYTLNNLDGQAIKGIWSGDSNPPALGDLYGVNFGTVQIAVKTTSYFAEAGEEEMYLGIRGTPLELPPDIERFGLGDFLTPGNHRQSLDNISQSIDIGVYGAETTQSPTAPNHCIEHGLTGEEEAAALLAIILGGKNWKPILQGAWMNGKWNQTPYPELATPLQRIRNTAGMDFIEMAQEKNLRAIEQTVAAIRQRRFQKAV